ncbi:MFS transporter [Streptomyces paludis]|uniref:MFS transporter n=1 Tax=Streptomyces paludis TaxID=2282738 RepID=UPI001E434A50|nr:MFS transporter [Streptomyces paludis]
MSVAFRQTPLWLCTLTLAAFAVQTDDFIIIGVLPELARDLRVSEGAAGQLVTVYSLVYALAAPAWALLLARIDRKRALCGALVVFAAANLAVPLVTSFPALMSLRVSAALAAAVVLPAALAAAAALAPPDRRGCYLSMVMTGLTGAVLIGVPAGTYIGDAIGWQATFVFAGVLGAAALLPALVTVPRSPAVVEPRTGVGELLRPVLDRTVLVVLLVTVVTVAGNLAFQTYLAPFLAGLASVTRRQLALLLVLSGVAGLVGTRLAGRCVDQYGSLRALVAAGGLFCAGMAAFCGLWVSRPVPLLPVAALLMWWSAAAWAVPPAVQALMVDRVGPERATQAMALHSSSAYAGAAVGGGLGGVLVVVDAGLLPAVAAVLVGLALGGVWWAARSARPGANVPNRSAGPGKPEANTAGSEHGARAAGGPPAVRDGEL